MKLKYQIPKNQQIKIDDFGVEFKSHLDGSKHYFTPEKIIDIQQSIGSDIMMCLDVCPPSDATFKRHKHAVNITTRWAERCFKYLKNHNPKYGYNRVLRVDIGINPN